MVSMGTHVRAKELISVVYSAPVADRKRYLVTSESNGYLVWTGEVENCPAEAWVSPVKWMANRDEAITWAARVDSRLRMQPIVGGYEE